MAVFHKKIKIHETEFEFMQAKMREWSRKRIVLGLKLLWKAKILQVVKSRELTDSLVLKGKQWRSGTSGSLWPVWSSAGLFFFTRRNISPDHLFFYCIVDTLSLYAHASCFPYNNHLVLIVVSCDTAFVALPLVDGPSPFITHCFTTFSLLHLLPPQQFSAQLSRDILAIWSL